ncbi:MAG: hypothetical protein ACK56F_09915, partial [bacterium]
RDDGRCRPSRPAAGSADRRASRERPAWSAHAARCAPRGCWRYPRRSPREAPRSGRTPHGW